MIDGVQLPPLPPPLVAPQPGSPLPALAYTEAFHFYSYHFRFKHCQESLKKSSVPEGDSFIRLFSDKDCVAQSPPLHQLQPIKSFANELKLHERAKGKYLSCVIGPQTFSYASAVCLVVRNEYDLSEFVQVDLWHCLPPCSSDEACAKAFPCKFRLTIAEPFVFVKDQRAWVACMNPCNVTVACFPSWEGNKITSPVQLRERGNDLLKQERFTEAMFFYKRSASVAAESTTEQVLALSNQVETLLQLNRPRQALKVCADALRLDPRHTKTLLRQIRAYEALRLYLPAVTTCERALATATLDATQNARVANSLQLNRYLLAQQQTGKYDWEALILTKTPQPPPLADYLGPLQLVRIPGKGRGMVVTKDVMPGELLMVCNPLVAAETTLFPRIMQRTNVEGAMGLAAHHVGPSVPMLPIVYDLAKHDADFLRRVSLLWSAEKEKTDELPLINDVSELHVRDGAASSDDEVSLYDAEHLQITMLRNMLGSQSRGGLYLAYSFLNHACVSNTTHLMLGKCMVLRASQKIKKGGEVFVQYKDPTDTPVKERAYSLMSWGFTCKCALCEWERGLKPPITVLIDQVDCELKALVDKVQALPPSKQSSPEHKALFLYQAKAVSAMVDRVRKYGQDNNSVEFVFGNFFTELMEQHLFFRNELDDLPGLLEAYDLMMTARCRTLGWGNEMQIALVCMAFQTALTRKAAPDVIEKFHVRMRETVQAGFGCTSIAMNTRLGFEVASAGRSLMEQKLAVSMISRPWPQMGPRGQEWDWYRVMCQPVRDAAMATMV
jgi:tetratricopeptide (TPR) repeat protein